MAALPGGGAFASVQGVGLESIRIPEAVPADAGNPGRAISFEYPSGRSNPPIRPPSSATVSSSSARGADRARNAATLVQRGRVSTSGDARGVATLAAFSMDVNGDGAIVRQTEQFPICGPGNGAEGTLQFYRVPATGDPALLSVVRFTGETTSVALDASERLAYVGLGARGVALVDSDGPASIQPLDVDCNGTDDRILGIVDTPGTAERLALGRGIGLVADGPAGLTALQLVPPRVTFTSLVRDPVDVLSGDQESILDSLVASSPTMPFMCRSMCCSRLARTSCSPSMRTRRRAALECCRSWKEVRSRHWRPA